MIHLQAIESRAKPPSNAFPFNVPAIRSLRTLRFEQPITLFIGENGSGKSTLLEAIAAGTSSISVGAHDIDVDASLSSLRELAKQLKFAWSRRTHRGFFLRAEDVFGFSGRVSRLKADLEDAAAEFDQKLTGYGRQLARGVVIGQSRALVAKYGENLDANSHGETFLTIFQQRFVPDGLYLLDEPEGPLSVQRQLSLVALLREMVRQDAQFIIATHSPVLMSLPEAAILSFDDGRIERVAYADIESVNLLRTFLNNPEAYLRRL